MPPAIERTATPRSSFVSSTVRGNTWYLRNSQTTGTADASFVYGNVGDFPLIWSHY